MGLRDRNKVLEPDCPHGGPYLSDSMIEFACGLVKRMMEAAIKHQKIVLGLGHEEGDIGLKAFGGITYVFAMANYIKELEDELKKGPILGIEDLAVLNNKTIHSVTPDMIMFDDKTRLVRKGITWEWGVNE